MGSIRAIRDKDIRHKLNISLDMAQDQKFRAFCEIQTHLGGVLVV